MLVGDVLIATGGVLTIALSGGVALPIVLGTASVVVGSAKFYFDVTDQHEKS